MRAQPTKGVLGVAMQVFRVRNLGLSLRSPAIHVQAADGVLCRGDPVSISRHAAVLAKLGVFFYTCTEVKDE